MFFVMTFINPHMLLTPWSTQEESKLSSIPKIYYLLLIIAKAIQLFSQNACPMEMNIYHREYFRRMIKRFKKGFTDETEKENTRKYQVEAEVLRFDFNDKFNFYPNLMCIDSKINVDNPYYVICLVLGIFITACNKF